MTKELENAFQSRTGAASSEKVTPVSADKDLTSPQSPQQESLKTNFEEQRASFVSGPEPAPTDRLSRKATAEVAETGSTEKGTGHSNSYIDPMESAVPEKLTWRDRIRGKRLSKVSSNTGSSGRSGSGPHKPESNSELGRGEVMPELITEKKVNWQQATMSMQVHFHPGGDYH